MGGQEIVDYFSMLSPMINIVSLFFFYEQNLFTTWNVKGPCVNGVEMKDMWAVCRVTMVTKECRRLLAMRSGKGGRLQVKNTLLG